MTLNCLNTIGFSQTGKDTLLSQPVFKNKHDSLSFSDTLKDNIKSKIPKLNTKQSLLGIKDSAAVSTSTDSTSQKQFSLSDKKTQFKNELGDSSKYKQQLPKPDLKEEATDTKSTLQTKKDTLLSQNKTKLQDLKPNANSFLKKQLKAIQPHGSIALGYEYGVLPFVAGDNYPSGGFKTEGNVSFLVMKIPLELTYYYTNIKNIIGLNNYFRLSYDADRYKEQLSQKMSNKELLSKDQLGKLQLQQQQMAQKLEYLKFLEQHPDYQLPSTDSIKTPINKNSLTLDSVQNPIPNQTTTIDTSIVSKYATHITDSLKNSHDYLRKKDSISNEVAKYQAKYDSISQAINTSKQELEQIKNLQNNPTNLTNPYLSKTQQFLSNIKKFEIGLCHPNYSTFLANNIPIQGINVEYSKNNNFLAFTYGTTINNLLYNTKTLQGTIQSTRNLYNYFDFGNLSAGRKILSVKGGIGAKDDSHLHVGFLLGKGKTNYLQLNPNETTSSLTTTESNLVLELDAKYKYSEQLSIDFIIGKSSVKEEDLSMEQIKKSINEIFSGYRSYAMLTRINAGIKKTKTRLTFTTRWVDPFFKSFGIGFLRSDNLRFEIKVEQPITSKIKYTVSYRREEDNLLRLYNYKNTLQTINNTLNLKLNRQFNVRLIYAPLIRVLKSEQITIKDKNHISTVILTYTPKFKKVNAQFNGLYSRYLITGDSTNVNFENVTYTHQFIFKSGFKTSMNVSWFKNSLKDTLSNNTYLSVLDVGYVSQKENSLTVGYKMAYKKGLEPQYGFVLKARIRLIKNLFWDAEMEKILIGDYYNSFTAWKIKKFPYYCNTRLILNF